MERENEAKIREIAKHLLIKRMVKEGELLSIIPSRTKLFNFLKILNQRFNLVGCEIIKTDYLNEDYYVVAIDGTDPNLTVLNYGILSIITFLYWEYKHNLSIKDAKKIFSENWDEIQSLIKMDYLRELETDKEVILVPMPITKVLFKNMMTTVNLDNIFKSLGIETDVDLLPKYGTGHISEFLPEELKPHTAIIATIFTIVDTLSKNDTFTQKKLFNRNGNYTLENYKTILDLLQKYGFLKIKGRSFQLDAKGLELSDKIKNS